MRIGSLAFSGLFLTSLGVAAVGACTGDVQTETGTTSGTGGTGGQHSTTVVTNTSTTVTSTDVSTSVATSTSSGGDQCMVACDHVQMCTGFDVCANGLKLDCSMQQGQCEAQCLNNIPCSMLNIQSGQACLQMCAPDSGPPADAGDQCMQACAHVQMCFGFDVCSQLGMQFDCSNPQNACVAQCIDNTPCGMLSQQTFQACQQQCQASDGGPPPPADGGGGMSDGGASAQACTMCTVQNCGQQTQGCFGNQACQGWLQCIQGCTGANANPACFTSCDAQHAGAKTQYDAIYTCACNSCQGQCGAVSDPCGTH
jgi:hypothetical protein